MATAEQVKGWLDKNADKAGSSDYVTMTEEYNKLSGTPPAAPAAPPVVEPPAPGGGFLDSVKNRFSAVMNLGNTKPGIAQGLPEAPAASDLPTAQDKMTEEYGAPDPYSASSRGGRLFTNVVTGIPDTGIAGYNAVARATGLPEGDYLAPQMRANAGIPELPTDAPWYDRYGEGLAAGVLGGGTRAAGAAIPRTMLRTGTAATTGMVGGEAGAGIAEQLGLDPQTGALLGSLLGGQVPRAAANVGRTEIAQAYTGHGRQAGPPGSNMPDAATIDAASRRAGIIPTPDMIGDNSVRDLITKLGVKPGSGPTVARAGDTARQQMVDAVSRVIDQQGGGGASSPAAVGGNAIRMAQPAMDTLQQASNTAAESLRGPMGRMEIPVGSVERAGQRLMPDLAGQGQDSINFRLNELDRLVSRPNIPGRPTVPASQLFNYRTELGRSLEQGARPPATTELYGPTTRALRTGAQQVGIPPAEFDAANATTYRFENQHRPALEAVTGRDAPQAHSYLLEGGEKVPARLTDFRDAMVEASPGSGMTDVNTLFGQHLNNILNDTLLKRGGNAPGPINFAERIQNADPQSIRELAGSLPSAQTLEDTAVAARAINKPTQQGGAGRTGAGVIEGATDMIPAGAAGHVLASAVGLPPKVAQIIGAAASFLGPRYLNNSRLAMANSPPARAAMLGDPIPYAPPVSLQDLKASMSAMQGTQSYPER